MLQVCAECLMVNVHGEIVDYELNRPFTYLRQITEDQNLHKIMSNGSGQVRLEAPPNKNTAIPHSCSVSPAISSSNHLSAYGQ